MIGPGSNKNLRELGLMTFLTVTLTFLAAVVAEILYTCVCIIVREICTAGRGPPVSVNQVCQASWISIKIFWIED